MADSARDGARDDLAPVASEDAADELGDADDYEPYLPPGPNPFSSVHPQGTPYRPGPAGPPGRFDQEPWPAERPTASPTPPTADAGEEQEGFPEPGRPPVNGQVPRPAASPYPPLPEDQFDGELSGQPAYGGASPYPAYTPYGPDDEIADDALTDYGLPSPQSYGYAPPPPLAEPLPDAGVPEPKFGPPDPSYRANGAQSQDPDWRGEQQYPGWDVEQVPSAGEPPADDEAPPAVSGRSGPAAGGDARQRGDGLGQHRATPAEAGLRGATPADAGTAPPRNPAEAPPLSQAAPPLGRPAP
ncbi:MAG TPA: hypothetical protein VGD68_09025, partial [Streptosporangiaceae bacterium]